MLKRTLDLAHLYAQAAYYYCPLERKRWGDLVETLRDIGIVRLPPSPQFAAKVLRLALTACPGQEVPPKYAVSGQTMHAILPWFTLPMIGAAFPELSPLLRSYYRRPAQPRHLPVVHRFAYEAHLPIPSNANWHTDYLHQCTLMVLLSEVTAQTTHMDYGLGTHARVKLPGIKPEPPRHCELIGPPGTAYLFDAGGIHRAHYMAGTERTALSAVFTTGHNLDGGRYAVNAAPDDAKMTPVPNQWDWEHLS